VPKTLKSVDAVTIGVGWTGGIIARELTKAGLRVVGLERGDFRNTNPDFLAPGVHDELAYISRNKLFQDPSRDTMTFRNAVRETALPIRQFTAFLPGDGLGGGSVHWTGRTWRFLEYDFTLRSSSVAKYGAAMMGDDCTSRDWGITYHDLEPDYDRFEYLAGISGKAGNLNGRKVAGANVFEGPRKREYPNPPMTPSYSQTLFRAATSSLGMHPFIAPSANVTRPYKNTEGVTMGACAYCGFCDRFSCEMSAKSSVQTTLLPVLLKDPNYTLRTNAHVLKINLDSSGKKATGVTYLDANGEETFQPAEMVFLTAFQLNNVHLLLLSGIGKPYDPATASGTIGRNYAYQAAGGMTLYFDDKHFNPFMGAGGLTMAMDDFNGDNFDHTGLGFVGGGVFAQSTSSGRPIAYHPVPPGTPRWGAAWKTAAAKQYNSTFSVACDGSNQSYRGNYLDLDPTYANAYGQPLMRITFDWGVHERGFWNWVRPKFDAIAKALGPKSYVFDPIRPTFGLPGYQSTHNTGGAIMGTDPTQSAVNTYQQSWDVPNVFSVGASSFPQNAGYNPTGTVGALAYRTAAAVVNRYVKRPGPLA
jgi:gluconate 2-dehydrogenase alpha chain